MTYNAARTQGSVSGETAAHDGLGSHGVAMIITEGTLVGGRWVLSDRIALGGMGEVFSGRDVEDDREVAVKLLRAGIAHGARRFAAEVAALERLEHRNIVRALGSGEHAGVPFLVMELVDGPSLAERLRDGAMATEQLAAMSHDVASALAFAHEHGVVHRDVKPSNVLFDRTGRGLVVDFGIAQLADATRVTATGSAIGSACYVAPEQLTDRDAVGPPADVYALGLVIIEAATGRRSFDGSPAEAALARLSRDPQLPDELPPPWRRLLRAMTAREAHARPSAAEVAQLLADGLPLDRTATLVLPPVPSSSTEPNHTTPTSGAGGHRGALEATTEWRPRADTTRDLPAGAASNADRGGAARPAVSVDGASEMEASVSDGSRHLHRRRWRAAGVTAAAIAALLVLVATSGDDPGRTTPGTGSDTDLVQPIRPDEPDTHVAEASPEDASEEEAPTADEAASEAATAGDDDPPADAATEEPVEGDGQDQEPGPPDHAPGPPDGEAGGPGNGPPAGRGDGGPGRGNGGPGRGDGGPGRGGDPPGRGGGR